MMTSVESLQHVKSSAVPGLPHRQQQERDVQFVRKGINRQGNRTTCA